MKSWCRQRVLRPRTPIRRIRSSASAQWSSPSDGELFTGANIENAAYPSSNCAEATAIHTAVAAGARKIDVVAVSCIDATDVRGAYPCGRCRQIMAEFGVEKVIVAAGEGSEIREHTLDDLLPYRFTL